MQALATLKSLIANWYWASLHKSHKEKHQSATNIRDVYHVFDTAFKGSLPWAFSRWNPAVADFSG